MKATWLTLFVWIVKMSPDDIDSVALAVFDLLVDLGCTLDENDDWDQLRDLLHDKLDRFCTRDRNYN